MHDLHFVRYLQRNHFPEQNCEGIRIASGIVRLGIGHFRSHVARGARHFSQVISAVRVAYSLCKLFGQTEIKDFDIVTLYIGEEEFAK
jgi:hypothetical protein